MFTPAPWKVAHLPKPSTFITSKKGIICQLVVYDEDDSEAQANANLIAVAPQLLEVLQGLHGALSRMIDKHNPDSIEAEWLAHSHEAIQKATGGT